MLKSLFRKKRKTETWFGYGMALGHLWFGLISSLVVFIVCITGSIYAFKNPVIEMSNREKLSVEIPTDNLAFSMDAFQEMLASQGRLITSAMIPNDKDKSISISYVESESGVSRTSYFNPYNLEELGNKDRKLESFFQTVLSLHRNLLLSKVGKQIVGASILIMLFLLISGFILWLPSTYTWQQIRSRFSIKWKAKFKRVNYDLHNTLGFYSLLMLFFIALTGLYVSYPWMKNAMIIGLGGQAVAGEAANEQIASSFELKMQEMMERQKEKNEMKDVQAISLDSLLLLSNQKLPYTGITLIYMPDNDDPRFRIKKLNNNNLLGAILPDYLSFDKKGEWKSLELFKDKPLHKQFIEISLPLHTGEIFGLPGIILYSLISLIGCSLQITGFYIWWGRSKKSKGLSKDIGQNQNSTPKPTIQKVYQGTGKMES